MLSSLRAEALLGHSGARGVSARGCEVGSEDERVRQEQCEANGGPETGAYHERRRRKTGRGESRHSAGGREESGR